MINTGLERDDGHAETTKFVRFWDCSFSKSESKLRRPLQSLLEVRGSNYLILQHRSVAASMKIVALTSDPRQRTGHRSRALLHRSGASKRRVGLGGGWHDSE